MNVSKRLRSYIDQLCNMSQNENQLSVKCEYAYMHEFIIKLTVYTDVIRLNLVCAGIISDHLLIVCARTLLCVRNLHKNIMFLITYR